MLLLEAKHITKRFGGLVAVDSFSMELEGGKIYGLVGPNGAGKTTVFNLISGLYRPDAGLIRFQGKDITRLPPHERAALGIGRTFQIPRLVSDLTVLHNVAIGRHARTRSGWLSSGLALGRARKEEEQIRELALRKLALLGISQRAYERAEVLPHGERRLVEVARALAMEPTLLLLDEPAAGLNTEEREAFGDTLLRVKELGTTILVVEHNVPFVMHVCDFVIVMDRGRKIADGTPSEIRDNEVVARLYLGRR